MLDRLRKLIGRKLAATRESDRRCPCCRATDAIKIDPLIAERGPRPLAFKSDRPMLCGRCWSLLLVDAAGDVTAADYTDLLIFRAAWPRNWRAIVACQQEYRRAQIATIREETPKS